MSCTALRRRSAAIPTPAGPAPTITTSRGWFIKLPFALRYNITIDIEIFYIQRDNLSDTP
ncbi:hypothetical protein D7042_01150 [Klebsiella pneumoniae]|nr:hypothetical protein D7039_01160 [Klebsiella pneumoniae]TXA57654.1 hypothetical protein D7041_12395 [Klebsiella pneumoniae]TXA64888.1 hypothetical protein D7040_17370 [Klebsiella pneumoniae]TXA66434.1 hypothetical protein D7034_09110 [Klebsiella pneumoniae]TXA83818.1 hypothetical protein D7037_00555 [Klebsiella pneumoniae]